MPGLILRAPCTLVDETWLVTVRFRLTTTDPIKPVWIVTSARLAGAAGSIMHCVEAPTGNTSESPATGAVLSS